MKPEKGGKAPVFYVNWKALLRALKRLAKGALRPLRQDAAREAAGPQFDQAAKTLLYATYLRPLRDAERAMSAGRGSRLSQILQHTKDIKEHGQGL